MALKLYNTLTRSEEEFKPIVPGKVGMYTCGPTVYNYLHIGNYRTYVFEDMLKRTFKCLGYQVRHVMNITDVGHLTSQADEGEDKMAVAARREGKSAWEIAKFYEKTFFEDIGRLQIDFDPSRPEDVLCRATEHIPKQIALIKRLWDKNLTYKIQDGVYFDISRFPDYGQLMGLGHHLDSKAGARIEVNPEKHNPMDFALWKFAPKGSRQMEWDSPWGWGFPGWHIECSAMAMEYLGDTFDIHCGGVDHVPIHHTNEIAQAEGATGKPFVKVWMHGEFLVMNKAKMAKSAGGFIRLQDLMEKGFDPLDFRYFCYTAHYRKQLEFSWEALEAAKTARRRLREKVMQWTKETIPPEDMEFWNQPGKLQTKLKLGQENKAVQEWLKAFQDDLENDLDVPEALASVYLALQHPSLNLPELRLAFLAEVDKVLALELFKPIVQDVLPGDLKKVFDDYVNARARKDYATSDKLRRQLIEQGIEVLDTKDGSRWKRL